MIDFHCHLDLYPNPQDVAAKCAESGLYVLSVTTTPSAWHGTAELGNGARRIRTALGLHPQLAHKRAPELSMFNKLLEDARYIGEIGLDGGREYKVHWLAQVTVFTHILEACAGAGGRIMSIHSRHAASEVLNLLESRPRAGIPVLHWFSGSRRELEHANRLGCWYSVGPAMLGSKKGRDLVARMPRDRILTESDGPFAQIDDSPVMPWQAGDALPILAELWSTSVAHADQMIHENLRELLALSPVQAPSVQHRD